MKTYEILLNVNQKDPVEEGMLLGFITYQGAIWVIYGTNDEKIGEEDEDFISVNGVIPEFVQFCREQGWDYLYYKSTLSDQNELDRQLEKLKVPKHLDRLVEELKDSLR